MLARYRATLHPELMYGRAANIVVAGIIQNGNVAFKAILATTADLKVFCLNKIMVSGEKSPIRSFHFK
ncbi:hypothetical protein DIU36_26965 [Mucilaginibacter rubeus]|nr:hypothetical protein DIU36_26965 [Mucilaginibacter rubeus]